MPTPTIDRRPPPVPWIAERLCGPSVLFLIHRGEFTAARTEISAQAVFYRAGDDYIDVQGTAIHYQHGRERGTVEITDIAEYARQLHHPERGSWLHATYTRLLRATSAWTPEGDPADPDHAAAELRAATAAWWTTSGCERNTADCRRSEA